MFNKSLITGLVLATMACKVSSISAEDAPAPNKCYSAEYVKEKAQLPLLHDLEGDELAAFNLNYENQFKGEKAPDVDTLLVFGVEEQEIWYLVTFKNGCATAPPYELPRKVFYEIRDGKKS